MTATSPGDRPANATLVDVAADVALHPSTVSRALDPHRSSMVKEATRRRVVEAAQRLAYRPHLAARSLMTGRTSTVAVIVADLSNTWVTPIIHGIASRVWVAGFVPIVAETNDDPRALSGLIDHMLSRRVDAIIILAARRQDTATIDSAGRIVPTVVAARPLLDTLVPTVTCDERRGGVLVAEHLADLGHRRVAQLRGPADVANFPLRDEGFAAVAAARGLEEIRMVGEAESPDLNDGERLMLELLDREGRAPTAVFAHNDYMALGAMTALRRRGLRVPEDMSVVGYNDTLFTSHLTPALTTVRFPGWEVGHEAADLALRLVTGDEDVGSVCFAPTLRLRESTAAPS